MSLLFSQSRLVERSLYPYAIFLQTVPIVAIAPLIVLWIGYGLQGVVAVANTTAGLTRVDPHLLDLFEGAWGHDPGSAGGSCMSR